jgi:hypothetical protein
MLTSIVLMSYLLYLEFVKRFDVAPQATPIAWTWYVLIGSLTTLFVAWAASFIFSETKTTATTN